MNWTLLWSTLFGTTDFEGLNMGFWVALGVVALIVAAQNVVFWRVFKPCAHGARDARPVNNDEEEAR